MKRRQFLQAGALMLVSGKFVYDGLEILHKKNTRNKIFNELADYVYMVEHIGIDKEGEKHSQKGVGFFVDDKFYSCAHISNLVREPQIMSPFGMFLSETRELKEKFCKIKEKELEILVEDIPQDIFIADASPYSKNYFREFPCEPSSERNLGDRVYIIGNPNLSGRNIRPGVISDLDGFGDVELTKGCFGTNIYATGGDSACPLVNEDYKLLGLAKASVNMLSYFIPIEKFTNYKPIIEKTNG